MLQQDQWLFELGGIIKTTSGPGKITITQLSPLFSAAVAFVVAGEGDMLLMA